MLNNESGLEPLGRAVLVKMQEAQKKDSLIAIPDSVKERQSIMEDRAVVVAIGKECWADEIAPRAEPGDSVIVTKMAGYVVRGSADGLLYRLVNDRDIFCKIVKENSDE